MTQEQKVIVREALLTWLDKGEKFTQSEMANRVKCSDAYISKIVNGNLNDKYPSNEVWQKVAVEVGIELKKTYWKHFDTANYTKIQFRLDLAKSENGLLVIDGQTGSGKTYALETYQRKQPSGCYYVKVHSEYGKTDLLLAILESMGEKPTSKRSFNLMQLITEKLNKPNAMLILDETEYMKTPCWHTVKALIDNTKKGENRTCTIVLAGCGIQKKLNNLATSKRSEEGWQQLLRRLKGNFPQLSVMQADKNEWTKEVRSILAELEIKDKEVITWFCINCANYGELETFAKRALTVANDTSTNLDVFLIKMIFE